MARIALGQLNLTVGDLAGNVARMAEATERATEAGAELIAFPELSITGYPPEDLVLRGEFVRENLDALQELANRTASGCDVVTGFVDRTDDGIHNAAALLRGGGVAARYHKMQLPNFGVFDERRYFTPGTDGATVEIGGLGSVSRCAKTPGMTGCRSRGTPDSGSIVNINGSPYHRGKTGERADILARRARQTGAWIVYVNMVGGQDELVFDGGSMVVSPDGGVRHRAAMFDEDVLLVDLHGSASFADDSAGLAYRRRRDLRRARTRAARLRAQERVQRRGARTVRRHRLRADGHARRRRARAAMPSARWRCPRRTRRPRAWRTPSTCAERLGIRLDTVPIEKVFDAYRDALAALFAGVPRTSPRRTCRRGSAGTC